LRILIFQILFAGDDGLKNQTDAREKLRMGQKRQEAGERGKRMAWVFSLSLGPAILVGKGFQLRAT